MWPRSEPILTAGSSAAPGIPCYPGCYGYFPAVGGNKVVVFDPANPGVEVRPLCAGQAARVQRYGVATSTEISTMGAHPT